MKAIRAIVCAVLVSLSLSGCVSLSEFFASFGFGGEREVFEAPQYKVGDAYTFGSPDVTWRVVAINDGRITWRSDTGSEQVTGSNPMLPALAWRSEKHGSGQRIISDKVGSLFPMRVGARMTFRADVSTDKPPYGWGFNWICEVQDRQGIAGPVGTIDAFKVGCGRENTDEMVFFYAPEIGHYVTKSTSSTGNDGARVKHLIAYEKMNSTGALERVAFNSRALEHVNSPVPKSPSVMPAAPEIAQSQPVTVQSAKAPVTQPSEIERRARGLLAQRKEVRSLPTEKMRSRAVTTDTLEERTIPAAGIERGAASPRTPEARTGYRLVARALPDFPPRPKLNPLRKSVESAEQVKEREATVIASQRC